MILAWLFCYSIIQRFSHKIQKEGLTLTSEDWARARRKRLTLTSEDWARSRRKDWPRFQKTEQNPEGRTDLEGVDESDNLRKEVGWWDAACIFSIIFHHPWVGVLFENTEQVLKIQTALKTQKQGWKHRVLKIRQSVENVESVEVQCVENTLGELKIQSE